MATFPITIAGVALAVLMTWPLASGLTRLGRSRPEAVPSPRGDDAR